jgi:hypothetical protein
VADSLKVLGQVDPAATTTTVLYTVPDKTQTTVSSIVAANDSLSIVIGITLDQTDVIKVYTSAVDMSFNIFGCETTEER